MAISKNSSTAARKWEFSPGQPFASKNGDLYAETLNSGIADNIKFCWKVLRLPEFKDCETTTHFLQCVDSIFDFLNIRNPRGTCLKSPLKRDNEDI